MFVQHEAKCFYSIVRRNKKFCQTWRTKLQNLYIYFDILSVDYNMRVSTCKLGLNIKHANEYNQGRWFDPSQKRKEIYTKLKTASHMLRNLKTLLYIIKEYISKEVMNRIAVWLIHIFMHAGYSQLGISWQNEHFLIKIGITK